MQLVLDSAIAAQVKQRTHRKKENAETDIYLNIKCVYECLANKDNYL